MALELDVEYPSNTTPGDANYPYGSAKNESTPGAEDGLPGEKEWFNDFLGFFQRLLTRAGITPSGNADTVLVSDYHDGLDYIINAAKTPLNAVVDGGMLVGEGIAVTLSGSYQYGQCPMIESKVDGTPSAGELEQAETALLGKTGFACLLNGVTVGAGGIIYYRHRMESKDVQRFISQAGIIHALVYHDVGSSINYTVTVNKADAQDDFSAVTNIDTSGSLAVDTGTETQISFAIANMGACGNGVEIIISAVAASVTTKDFYITELTLQPGTVIAPFKYQTIAEAGDAVLRYFEKVITGDDNTPFGGGFADSTTNAKIIFVFLPKRYFPVVTLSDPAGFRISNSGTLGVVSAIVFAKTALDRAYLSLTSSTLTTGEGVIMVNGTGLTPYILVDARL